MELIELKAKLVLERIKIEKRMNEVDKNSEQYTTLALKYTFVSGVLGGLEMLTVNDKAKSELFKFLNDDDENGKENFIEKIYKE